MPFVAEAGKGNWSSEQGARDRSVTILMAQLVPGPMASHRSQVSAGK